MKPSSPLFIDRELEGVKRKWLIHIDSALDTVTIHAYHQLVDSVPFVGSIKLPCENCLNQEEVILAKGFQFTFESGSVLTITLDEKEDLLAQVANRAGEVISRYTLSE